MDPYLMKNHLVWNDMSEYGQRTRIKKYYCGLLGKISRFTDKFLTE